MLIKLFYAFLIAAVFIAAVVIYTNPPEHRKYYPPCIFKKFTGFDCAGCGSTRACYHLLHGHILQAANHNILLLLFIPVMFIGLVYNFTGRLAALWQKINKPFIFLMMILLFWVVRNIPFYPWQWLHSDK